MQGGRYLETREGRRSAARTSPEARDFMLDNHDSWRVVGPRHGGYGDRCGLVAHRGVVHRDEYVDPEVILPEVERGLGFTLADMRQAYRHGRPPPSQTALRARIDARLLALRNAGGNLELLARVTGVDRKTIGRALARARASVAVTGAA